MKVLKKIRNWLVKPNSVDSVVRSVELTTGFDLEALRSPVRGKKVSGARRLLIRQLDTYTSLSVAEIASHVNRSTQYVYDVLNQ